MIDSTSFEVGCDPKCEVAWSVIRTSHEIDYGFATASLYLHATKAPVAVFVVCCVALPKSSIYRALLLLCAWCVFVARALEKKPSVICTGHDGTVRSVVFLAPSSAESRSRSVRFAAPDATGGAAHSVMTADGWLARPRDSVGHTPVGR